jgi:hypothetical protein
MPLLQDSGELLRQATFQKSNSRVLKVKFIDKFTNFY